jgi:hypothetical protein
LTFLRVACLLSKNTCSSCGGQCTEPGRDLSDHNLVPNGLWAVAVVRDKIYGEVPAAVGTVVCPFCFNPLNECKTALENNQEGFKTFTMNPSFATAPGRPLVPKVPFWRPVARAKACAPGTRILLPSSSTLCRRSGTRLSCGVRCTSAQSYSREPETWWNRSWCPRLF